MATTTTAQAIHDGTGDNAGVGDNDDAGDNDGAGDNDAGDNGGDNAGDNDDDDGVGSFERPEGRVVLNGCEGAFAFSLGEDAIAFDDPDADEVADLTSQRWGWTRGPLEDGTYRMAIVAAGGRAVAATTVFSSGKFRST